MFSTLIFLLILILPLTQVDDSVKEESLTTVNAIIGDISFVEKFERAPNDSDSESLRIVTHLEYVINELNQADVFHLSQQQANNRTTLIKLLEQYIQEERFPKNYDFQDQRRPTFIDIDGNICAVGYLVQQTVGQAAAENINSGYKYGYVMEMNSDLLDNWLTTYGLSKKEAAMIQPSYAPVVIESENKNVNQISRNYALTSSLLLGTQSALTSLTFNSNVKLTPRKKMLFSAISTGLGVVSIVSGVTNLDNNTRIIDIPLEPDGITMFPPIKRVTETNQSNINLSILNIAFGTFSTVFNGYRTLRFHKMQTSGSLSLNSSVQYIPTSIEPIPTLSFSLRL